MIKILERLGVPRTLMLGFLAVAIFMTGDGFELTFLSKFMVDQGFTSSQASLLVTVYGLFAAFGGWSAGVLAEMFGARKVMMFGACWWIGVHLLFLGIAIPSHIYPLILCLYAMRGIGYLQLRRADGSVHFAIATRFGNRLLLDLLLAGHRRVRRLSAELHHADRRRIQDLLVRSAVLHRRHAHVLLLRTEEQGRQGRGLEP